MARLEETEGLPEGWALTQLSDGLVIDVQPGFACGVNNRGGRGVAHMRPMNVSEEGRIRLADVKYVPEEEADGDRRRLRYGDILFNNTNSPELVGKTAFYDLTESFAFSNHMTRLRCNPDAIAPRFCAKLLHQKWHEGHFLSVCNNHVSQASVSSSVLLETEIRLPPLPEQKRIVAKVEKLLARVNAGRERLDRVPRIMRRFRQAVLAAACSGRLTEGWRQENAQPDLKPTMIGDMDIDIQTGPFGSALHQSDYVLNGTPLINPMHIRDGAILPSPDYSVSDSKLQQLHRHRLQKGDVILGRRGEMGRAAVVREEHEGLLCGTGCMFLRFNRKRINADFLCIFLRSPETAGKLEQSSVGSTMTNLNQSIIRSLELSMPLIGEQREIVRRVEALFKLADAIEKRVAAARLRADKLTQSILAKAFRGDLVPTEAELARREGRSYEPAFVLLERIGAERDKERPHAKKRRTRG